MLNKKVIAIAEALAIDVKQDLAGTVASPVILAANQALGSVIPLTAENYQDRLPVLTHGNDEYSTIANEVASIMAENMRATFDQIRVYGRGVTGSIMNQMEKTRHFYDNITNTSKSYLMGNLDIEFIRTDHPFFSSLMYPTKVPNTQLSFAEISIDSLRKLAAARWDTAQIVAWLGIDSPEINELLMSSNVDLPGALDGIFNPWGLPFDIVNNKGEFIDFNKPRLDRSETLFVQYILVCKMMAEEAPFEGLTNGSLTDYRSQIKLLHSALSLALIKLKQIASSLSSAPIRLVEDGAAAVREEYPTEGSKPFKRVRAKAVLYYNMAGLQMCVDNRTTFAEIAAAYFHQKYVGLEPTLAQTYLSNPNEACNYLCRVASGVKECIIGAEATTYNQAIGQGVRDFVHGHAELKDDKVIIGSVDKMLVDTNWGQQLAWKMSEGKCGVEDAIFATGIPGQFLLALGCKDAFQILRCTVNQGNDDDSELDKRELLHLAVIEHFVNKLLTAK